MKQVENKTKKAYSVVQLVRVLFVITTNMQVFQGPIILSILHILFFFQLRLKFFTSFLRI